LKNIDVNKIIEIAIESRNNDDTVLNSSCADIVEEDVNFYNDFNDTEDFSDSKIMFEKTGKKIGFDQNDGKTPSTSNPIFFTDNPSDNTFSKNSIVNFMEEYQFANENYFLI